MADVNDAPQDLKHLARVIPALTIAQLEPVELQLRLDYAAQLIGQADLSDDGEARRLRRKAREVLEAPSLRQKLDIESALDDQISEAVRDGDDRLAEYLRERLKDFRSLDFIPDEWLRDYQLAGVVRSAERRSRKSPAAKRPRFSRFRRTRSK